MKKIWSFFLVVVLVFGFGSSVIVKASEVDNGSTVVSEKDVIISWMNSTDDELRVQGYSDSEIKEIRSYDFEKIFLERASLSTQTLKNYGYSDSQIDLLKEYKGETITSDSAVLDASSDVTISFLKSSYISTPKKINVIASWSWNIVPIFKTTDLFVVTFQGINSDLIAIDVTPTRMSGSIKYYRLTTGAYNHTSSYTGKYNSLKRSVSSPIAMTKNDNYYWAKSGTLSLQLEPLHSTVPINYVNVGANYGHRTVNIIGSIDYNLTGAVSVSFTPSLTSTKVGSETGRVLSDGRVLTF